jgi:hypothetical protein
MPLSSADGHRPTDPTADEPPIVHPSDAEISAALHEVVEMAHCQCQQEGRKVNLT